MGKARWYDHEQTLRVVRLPGSGRRWGILATGVAAVLLLLVLFAGEKNLPRWVGLSQERRALHTRIEALKEQNNRLRRQIQELEADPRAVAPIARSELGLVYPGEILYRFVPPPKEEAGNAHETGGAAAP